MFGRNRRRRIDQDRERLRAALDGQIEVTRQVDVALSAAYRQIDELKEARSVNAGRLHDEREKNKRLRSSGNGRSFCTRCGLKRHSSDTCGCRRCGTHTFNHRNPAKVSKGLFIDMPPTGIGKTAAVANSPTVFTFCPSCHGVQPWARSGCNRCEGHVKTFHINYKRDPVEGRMIDKAEDLVRAVRSERSRPALRQLAFEYVMTKDGKPPGPKEPNAVTVLRQIAGKGPGPKLHRLSETEADVILELLEGKKP